MKTTLEHVLIFLCQHCYRWFFYTQGWHLSWGQKFAAWTLCLLQLSWRCRSLCPLRDSMISSRPQWNSWFFLKKECDKKILTESRFPLEDLWSFSTSLLTLGLWVFLGSHRVCWGSERSRFHSEPRFWAYLELLLLRNSPLFCFKKYYR